MQWIRDVRPAVRTDHAPAGWFVATIEARCDENGDTFTASFIVGPGTASPQRPDWSSLQSASYKARPEDRSSRERPAHTAALKPSPDDFVNPTPQGTTAVELVTDPNWRRSACIVCGSRIVRARDAHNVVGGTLDGSWLVCWPTGPEHLAMTGPIPDGQAIYLLGACHRACLPAVSERIRAGAAHLSPLLAELSWSDADDLEYTLHLPADESTCLFCGSAGPMTNEHVWPKWLSKELKKTGARFATPPGAKRAPTAIDLTVGVCRPCNNDWLSTLENDVAGIARPMLRGHLVRLDETDQGRLATWATKTAYLLDRWSDPIVPRGFAMDLAIRRAPPANTCVFLAAYDGPRAAYASHEGLHVAGPDGLRPLEANAFATTFTAHKLAFQVLGHFNKGGWQLLDDRPALHDGLVQIWPNLEPQATWPPKLILPNAGIEALAKSVSTR